MPICVECITWIISFNSCVSQFKLIYAAITNNSQISMAYKTKVYFFLAVDVRLFVVLPHLRAMAQGEGTVPVWVIGTRTVQRTKV